MSDKKTTIVEQVDRAIELIEGRGAAPDPADHSIRATLRQEFQISDRSARGRIRHAVKQRRVSEYHQMSNRNQIMRTLTQLDALIDDDKTPAKEKIAAIDRRISLLGLSPAERDGPKAGDPPQAPFPTDLSLRGPADAGEMAVARALAGEMAVARAREKATDREDKKP